MARKIAISTLADVDRWIKTIGGTLTVKPLEHHDRYEAFVEAGSLRYYGYATTASDAILEAMADALLAREA